MQKPIDVGVLNYQQLFNLMNSYSAVEEIKGVSALECRTRGR